MALRKATPEEEARIVRFYEKVEDCPSCGASAWGVDELGDDEVRPLENIANGVVDDGSDRKQVVFMVCSACGQGVPATVPVQVVRGLDRGSASKR